MSPRAAERVISREQAVDAAHDQFCVAGTVDMAALADALAVSRATLYRVCGGRDRLLGDVLWHQGSRRMAQLRRAAPPGGGVERLVALAHSFNVGVLAYPPMRAFLSSDPSLAFRVLFMREAEVHGRFVALWTEIFTEESGAGAWRPPADVGDTGYLFVRLGESMMYAELLAGREPHLGLVRHLQRLALTLPIS